MQCSSWNQEDPDQAYSDANTNSWNSIAVNENGTHVIAASAANVYTGFDTTLENNSQTFANTGNGQTIALTTPSGTNVTCHSITSASSLSVADTGYSYPLGLVDFCFNNAQESNKITLTFVTNLTPSQVVLRFYNSSTKQYSTITDAVITETSYNGQPALQVSYYIPDNGLLDTDANFGTISDPVGLAVAENSTTIKAPDTGYGTTNNKAINITTLLATVSLSAGLVINNLRRKIKQ